MDKVYRKFQFNGKDGLLTQTWSSDGAGDGGVRAVIAGKIQNVAIEIDAASNEEATDKIKITFENGNENNTILVRAKGNPAKSLLENLSKLSEEDLAGTVAFTTVKGQKVVFPVLHRCSCSVQDITAAEVVKMTEAELAEKVAKSGGNLKKVQEASKQAAEKIVLAQQAAVSKAVLDQKSKQVFVDSRDRFEKFDNTDRKTLYASVVKHVNTIREKLGKARQSEDRDRQEELTKKWSLEKKQKQGTKRIADLAI